jgi:hypothetical protein
MKYIPLFILIQLVNLPLTILGAIICLWPRLAYETWLWWNDDDPPWNKSWVEQYYWLALRNPVANLRRIPGVSGAGRPLLYRWWTSTPNNIESGWYVKIGWESGPPYYPVLSAGDGRGY